MAFPESRPRRLRRLPALRRMIRETTVSPDNFIYPLFVCPGKGIKREISSLPGQYHLSIDQLAREAEEIAKLGIPGVLLFGLPEKKDEVGSEAWHPEGVVQRAIRAIKKAVPDLCVIVDACFCEYTSHGHCGVLVNGQVDNDATLENLNRAALSYARAGVDVVAPSGMMDGFVGFLREGLDEEEFSDVAILSYAAKYASAYYGPFRVAADSAPSFGDRHGYQMDPANVREAIREIALDIDEGADIVMVKPALAYLDIVSEVRREFDVPICTYNVSGEYAMIKAAAAAGWIDHDRVMMETLLSMRRAGADMIITYHAKEAAKLLTR
ncbi:MAG TPA: porphobilinogen synthase [Polyangia bacterium]|jgi:porphobilinogen synthase|nr:porphobilinogen synthase [Polyangia bacterium]